MSGSNALLDALAHPAQINLLADYGNAANTADAIWRNKLFQAQQAAGEAFQRSIGPDGTPNQALLNQNLVAAGPTAALSAQSASQAGQTLDTETFDTHMKRLTGVNAAAMALTAQYPNGVPQQAVNDELDRVGPVYGLTPQQIAQAKTSFGADPVANSRTIIRNGIANLQAQDALHASRPAGITIDNGQGIKGGNVAPAAADQPGAISMTGQTVPTGFPTRTQMLEQVGQPADAVSAAQLGVPVGTPITFPMIQRWQQQGAGAGLVGPAGAVAAGSSPGAGGAPPPTTGASTPPVPSPIPGGGVYRPRQTVTPQAPAVTTPAPGAPAATTRAAGVTTPASPAGATPGVAAQSGGLRPVVSGPPAGYQAGLDKDVEAFKTAQAAIGPANTSIHSLQNAYEALKLTNSGSGTEATHKLYAFIENQAPDWLKSQRLTDDVKNYDLFRKYAEKYALDQGAASNTDAGRSMAAASNAGTAISTPANFDVIRAEIGRQRQAVASVLLHNDPSGNGYLAGNARFTTGTDPHGFAWDMYSPAERQALINKAKENGTYDKLVASVKAGVDSHQITIPQPPSAAPPPTAPAPQQPAVTPPALGPQAMAYPLAARGLNRLASRTAFAPAQQRNMLAIG